MLGVRENKNYCQDDSNPKQANFLYPYINYNDNYRFVYVHPSHENYWADFILIFSDRHCVSRGTVMVNVHPSNQPLQGDTRLIFFSKIKVFELFRYTMVIQCNGGSEMGAKGLHSQAFYCLAYTVKVGG